MAADMMNHKKVLERIAELISQQQSCGLAIAENQQDWQEELGEQKKKTGETFMVLVVGAFNSGKSSLINAMIGEEFLPTGMLPETGVLCEMHYGLEKSITLYPKPGKWEGGDEPFALNPPTVSEIAKYCSIDNAAQMSGRTDTANVKFEKVVVRWPLEILKDGVVLVDSVGMNDPFGNDYITKAYFPRADAVIYLLNGVAPYTATDEDLLYEINDYGLRSVIGVCTYFDSVQKNYAGNPEKLRAYCDTIRSHCSQHSDLGRDGVHFVNSRGALKAKLSGDEAGLVESGVAGLEAYLSKYLVENKGSDQVDVLSRYMFSQAAKMREAASVQDAASEMSEEELKKRIEVAEEQLAVTRRNAETAGKTFRTLMESVYPTVDRMIEEHYAKLLETLTLDEYEPQTQLPAGFAALNPVLAHRKAKELAEECNQAIASMAKKQNADWMKEKLNAALDAHVQKSTAAVELQMRNVVSELQCIDDILAGHEKKSDAMDVASRVLGFLGGLMIGDISLAANGAAFGMRGMVRALGFQALTGAALGLAFGASALIAPVVIPAALIANIVAILTDSNAGKIKRAKKEALKGYCKQYEKDQLAAKGAEEMKKAAREWIGTVCATMDDIIAADIAEKRKLIDATISGAQTGIDEKRAACDRRAEAVRQLDKVDGALEDIRREYGLAALKA